MYKGFVISLHGVVLFLSDYRKRRWIWIEFVDIMNESTGTN